MRIEDTRGLHVGDVGAFFAQDDVVLAAFHHHAAQAQWHTLNRLISLSGRPVDQAASAVIGIVEWWRTIETLVSLLYETALRESDLGLRPDLSRLSRGANADVLDKWSRIARWFSDGTDSAPREVTGRLIELRDFRNSFEHSSRAESRSRHHTRLSESPAVANEFDLMESLAICVNCCSFLRSALSGSDVMPKVVVPAGDSLFFESIDVVAEVVLVPTFLEIVEARSLTTDFALYETPRRLRGQSQIRVGIHMRYEDEHPLAEPRREVDVHAALLAYGSAHPARPPDGRFRLPNYSAA